MPRAPETDYRTQSVVDGTTDDRSVPEVVVQLDVVETKVEDDPWWYLVVVRVQH